MMKWLAVSTALVLLIALVTVAVSEGDSGSSASNPSGAPSSDSASDTQSVIRILLTSDLQYNLFPVHSNNQSLCFDTNTEEEQTTTDCIGGLSRLVSYINNITFDLAVDAGNIAGQTYFPQLKFNPLTRVVELLNFTALAVDVELLKYGADAAQQGFLSKLSQIAVAANLGKSSAEVAKSKTVTWEKCEVAVIGVVSKSRVEELSVPGVNASDEVSAVQQELGTLTKQSSNTGKLITIVAGDIDDITAAAISKITGVNMVIVSGTNISDSDVAVTDVSSVVKQDNASYIVKLQRNSHFPFVVGNLQVIMEGSGCNINDVKLDPFDYSTVSQTDNVAVRELEKEGMTRLEQLTSSRLGVSTGTIPSTDCDTKECALGNLVTDAVVSQLMVQEQNTPRLAVFPGHRFSNNSQLPTVITGTAVDTLFDGDEFLYSLHLSAPQLKELLEESVRESNSSGFLQMSALMNVQFNISQPEDSRVESVHVVLEDTVVFSNINLTDSSTSYSVAVPASMLQSYSSLQAASSSIYMLSVSEAVKFYLLRTQVLVVQPAGNRVTYVEDNSEPSSTTTTAPGNVTTAVPSSTTTTAPGNVTTAVPSSTATAAPSTKTTTTPAPPSPVVSCPDNTAATVMITLMVTAVCVAAGSLFWVYAMPRIRLYRARRDSSLPLVVQY